MNLINPLTLTPAGGEEHRPLAPLIHNDINYAAYTAGYCHAGLSGILL